MPEKLRPESLELNTGLKLVLINLPNFHSLTNFLVIRSGSRYEDRSTSGLAHFLEHMVFKGTEHFPDTLAVARSIEEIGGYFNAWTANDHTAYWNVVPSAGWQAGLTMPFELAFRPSLRDDDLDRERGVIIEEIRRIQDDPASLVDDEIGKVLFLEHPLGRSIIGTEENIGNFSIEQLRHYRQTHYHLGQSLMIVIGDLQGKDIAGELGQLTDGLPRARPSQAAPFTSPSRLGLRVINKKTDQTHFMLGLADSRFALTDGSLFIAEVLNTVLGQGMSSRLFLNIREAKGLAYSIHSQLTSFEETGALTVYGGVNTEKIDLSLQALDEELNRLAAELVPSDELNKAKALIQGRLGLNQDNPLELAKWYGTGSLLGADITLEEAKEKVEAVNAEQVQSLAREVFDRRRRVLTVVGPYKKETPFRRFLGLTS